jgi:hypothetical protein
VSFAAEFGGDVLVGRVIIVRGPQDESATQDQGLRRGARSDQRQELLTEFVGQRDRRAKGTWHERPPCVEKDKGVPKATFSRFAVCTSRYWKRTYELDI